MERPAWPLIRQPAAEWVIGPVFVHGIASRTLAGLKHVVEERKHGSERSDVKPRRVVITGVGVVTPIGTGREQFWEGLQEQVSKVGPVTRFDPSPFRTRMAGEVPDFRPADHIEARRVRRFDRFAQFGVAATRLAIADADLDLVARGRRANRVEHGDGPRRRRPG